MRAIPLPPFAAGALRLLGERIASSDIGWRLASTATAEGAELVHADGHRASLAILTPAQALRKTDTTQHLRALSQHSGGAGKLLILYSHRGFLPGAEKAALNRVANTAVLASPVLRADRYRVELVAASAHTSEADLQLVRVCADVIERSVFGTVSSAHGELRFESFSVDPASVSAITFMTEGECGRRRKELVREASRSILLATFNFDDDELANLLIERAREIPVRCVLSAADRLRRNANIAAKLRAGGVSVEPVNSHAKCVVIDGERVLLVWDPETLAGRDPETLAGSDPPAALRGLR